MAPRPVARVLLHAPLPQLDRLLDYEIPEHLLGTARAGVRVRVPLRGGRRLVDGYIAELGEAADPDRPLSQLDAVLSPVPVLPPGLATLARRVADRAAGSASDILRLAIPRRSARIEAAWAAAMIDDDGRIVAAEAPLIDPARLERARAVLAAHQALSEAIVAGERVALDAQPGPVIVRDAAGDELTIGGWALLLAAASTVTLAAGRSAVIAVPDYRDLEQVLAACAEFAPATSIVRDDASGTPAKRTRAYLRMLQPTPCIVVGNRSAVYAPAHDTGLVVVWDDGDPLHGEPLAPGVHARDAALVRQEHEGSALIIAGHTRTSDAQRLVQLGWLRESPPARRMTPTIVLGAESDTPGQGRVSSAAFRAAREALAAGPVLVQVARPGFAPVLVCDSCRAPARCAHCGGPLHAKARGALPECRWCGRGVHGWACRACGGERFRFASSGSRRTADELGRAFPGIRIIVSDGAQPISRVDARPALVIATRGAEPIAAGGYRAVILLDADRMLMGEALRTGESCLRWWSNAAALAAPGAPVHLTGVAGDAPRALATWTQPRYAAAQLAERAPLRLPPAVRVALIEGEPAAVDAAISAAISASGGVDALGPIDSVDAEGEPLARALVRFDYGAGPAVSASLRASVIQAALRTRKPRADPARGERRARTRTTLKVRLDVAEPSLDDPPQRGLSARTSAS